jgi:hypothetical protein
VDRTKKKMERGFAVQRARCKMNLIETKNY